MDMLDSLEQAAGLEKAPAGQAAPQGLVGAVVQMLQSQPGGIGGVVQQFESSGLGGAAQSWLGGGANQAVSPGDIKNTLGAAPVDQVATQLGVSHDEAAGHIFQLLPLILDHASPNGQAPAGGGLSELEGLMSRFGGGQQ